MDTSLFYLKNIVLKLVILQLEEIKWLKRSYLEKGLINRRKLYFKKGPKLGSNTFTQSKFKFVYLNLVQVFMYVDLTQTQAHTNLVQVCLRKFTSSVFPQS